MKRVVNILLIVGVLAVTGLNSFVAKSTYDRFTAAAENLQNEQSVTRQLFQMQMAQSFKEKQIERLTQVVESEAQRATVAEAKVAFAIDRYQELEKAYTELKKAYVLSQMEYQKAQAKINSLNQDLKEATDALRAANDELRKLRPANSDGRVRPVEPTPVAPGPPRPPVETTAVEGKVT